MHRQRYKMLREEAHQVALVELAPFLDAPLTDLTSIREPALRAWEQQWRPCIDVAAPWASWDWRSEIAGWYRHIDRFELAIWSGEHLCGLVVGKPSPHRRNLSIYLLQGSPVENHPLKGKILAIALDAALAYGTALGCNELRLVRPLSGMIGRYERLGFRLEVPYKATPYCVRPL